jgi:hypothetical protein
MCKIKKCKGKVLARGLCAKHYMRLRRTGNPEQVRQPGRPQLPFTEHLNTTYPEMSARTKARFRKAMQLLQEHFEPAAVDEVLDGATRPSGGFNVSKMLQLTQLPLDRYNKTRAD